MRTPEILSTTPGLLERMYTSSWIRRIGAGAAAFVLSLGGFELASTSGAEAGSKDGKEYYLLPVHNSQEGLDIRCEIDYKNPGSTDYPELADKLLSEFKNTKHSGYTTDNSSAVWSYFENSLRESGRGFNKRSADCFVDGQQEQEEHPRAATLGKMVNNGAETATATAKSVDKYSDPITDPTKAVAEAVVSCPYGWHDGAGCKGNPLPGNVNPWAKAGIIPDEAREPFVDRNPSSTGNAVLVCVLMPGDSTNYTELGEILARERERATQGDYLSEYADKVAGLLDRILGGYDPEHPLCYIEKPQTVQ